LFLQLQVTLLQIAYLFFQILYSPFGVNQFLEDILEFFLRSIGPAHELFEHIVVAALAQLFEFSFLGDPLQFLSCALELLHVSNLR
jgi:hypothetical protein